MDSRASSLMTEAMSWQDFIASKFLRHRAPSGEGIPEWDDPEMLVARPSDCVPTELVEGTTLTIDEPEEDIRPVWRRRGTPRSQDENKKGSREQRTPPQEPVIAHHINKYRATSALNGHNHPSPKLRAQHVTGQSTDPRAHASSKQDA
ncbi:hypothetical protein GW17_00053514, partial [Ensete ventricosum]